MILFKEPRYVIGVGRKGGRIGMPHIISDSYLKFSFCRRSVHDNSLIAKDSDLVTASRMSNKSSYLKEALHLRSRVDKMAERAANISKDQILSTV